MSDLQCAARLIVVNPPGLVDIESLVSSLAHEKVAAVYAADDVPDPSRAELLAERLSASAELVRDSLLDGAGGFEEIVDRHRGETVVVVRRGEQSAPELLLVDADGITSRPLG
ncbi:hypothetical protein BA895_09945 [Humibacillus sp. DSM 29435]|uniref:hypothetical protein n=1 Tax=Humibacillus sp. DSM 29435 TaxID=1869167 RepID=UPI000872C42C|nr:hypothetical protein [Humibacillus sp. DSM 29435]OFE14659.1 hypothetical protein BA895_09945 [Humibacillus sp. DSM 29435]